MSVLRHSQKPQPYDERLGRIEHLLEMLVTLTARSVREEKHMSKELDDLVAEVSEVKGAAESGAVAIKGLADALNGVLLDSTDYESLKAGVTAQVAELHSTATALGDAIAANPVPVKP
jgi:hypothetical protein